jgi:hypothetical protein
VKEAPHLNFRQRKGILIFDDQQVTLSAEFTEGQSEFGYRNSGMTR